MYLKMIILLFVLNTITPMIFCDSDSSAENSNRTSTLTYTTKYDNINLDEILQNDRLLKNYVNCLQFEGPCTPDAKTLRDILPDAINSNCTKCSEKQKIGSEKVTYFLIDNKPDMWDRLEQIYDPEGNYKKAYLESKSNNNQSTIN